MALETVRLDKWLWAARFFKTRMLAKKGVEGGKVHLNGEACKVSRQVKVGDELRIRQGFDEKIVTVLALSESRGTATQAALLFEETKESLLKRQEAAKLRSLSPKAATEGRPTKRDRRKIIKFLGQN